MHFAKSFGTALLAGAVFSVPAFAQSEDEAVAAIRAWLEAIMSADPAQLDAVMAPEFQIERSNGTGHDKAGYIDGGFARIASIGEITDVHVTVHDDLMVVRYMLGVQETISGQPVQGYAPRLTVFRREDDRWLVVAHANFARAQ